MGVCNVYLINSRPLCTHDMLYTWSSQKRKLKEYGLERESLMDGLSLADSHAEQYGCWTLRTLTSLKLEEGIP